ncbi:MAG: DUF2849 domain-containing protein [Pararhodobacter sp.]|nr:DUF2849 domain-containing protein [Pararhodobacter sp.]
MSRKPQLQVVTANALISGHSVWLTASGGWSPRMGDARVFDDPQQAQAALAHATARSDIVVGAYLAPVRAGVAGPEPVHFREAFRRDGPSPAANAHPRS